MTAISSSLRGTDPLRPQQRQALGRGFAFAAVAHAALLVALSAGVQWKSQPTPAFEAELWSAVPKAAAPPAVEPEPVPESQPEPTPARPTQAPAPDPAELQAQRDADIALAKQKERKAEEQRLAELAAERKRKDEEKRLKEREAQEKLRKDELARQKKLEQEKLDKKRQQEADQKAKEAKEAKDAKQAEAKREALRQENLRRIQGMAGGTGSPGSTGTAAQSSGPSAGYGGRIKARIRPNIIFNDPAAGNPVAEVEVRTAPDGKIISYRISRASGDADWDRAVLRAIEKTETLPRDTDGRVPPVLLITFQPRE